MRKFLFLLWCMIAMAGYAEVNQTTSKGSFRVVTSKVVGYHKNHLSQPVDCPDVFYNSINNCITIDFGTQLVNNYTVTISSLYADVDYYVTSSFTTIPLAVDGFSDYSIVIETADGDVFMGTLEASEYATSQTM